jgi:replicative DNA helicase Mcm
MKASLRQFGFEPETGKIDIDRVEGHMTSKQRSKVRTFWDLVEELSKAYDKNIPQDELIKRGLAEGIENIEEMLEKELLGGRMYSPAAGILRKVE